ncbi:hypothetical protein N0V82_001626 [Gnomoniopsis sp. IMI 355080]|nr:hypothetical protein N0V82_001626 [Gnomoniopsis sp. IMI 355080]
MSDHPPITPSTSKFVEDLDTTIDAPPPLSAVLSEFSQRQVERAIAASLETFMPSTVDQETRKPELIYAKRLHDIDLWKTQDSYIKGSTNNGNVLLLVEFPKSRSAVSCRFTSFKQGRIRLTYEQVLSTGSDLLAGLLVNERHQRRAKKAAAPLPEGVGFVLDLSPITDEDDHIIALQLLSAPRAVQLWHRSMALGASPLAVAGHDDVCTCLVPLDEPYPFATPPASIKSEDGNFCILDTHEWPLEENRKIDDFCTTRWAANTLRLFRAISMPPGQKDLVIDSAPRMWTMVGLFAKLEMTNYDILRDEVVAWFNADMNHAFVELFPEETLHIGHILQTPLLSEPAFRILVNERALELAGGQPRSQPTTTLFGRRCSEFTGTDIAESISRMIEHASCAMAERYKNALDKLCGDNGLDLLGVPEWQELRALDQKIPKKSKDIKIRDVRVAYDKMIDMVRQMLRESVERRIAHGSEHPPTDCVEHFRLQRLTVDRIEEKRALSVPKKDLSTTQSFHKVYNSLNRYQRALTPFVWHSLIAMADDRDWSGLVGKELAVKSMRDFRVKFDIARREGKLLGVMIPDLQWSITYGYCKELFKNIMEKLKDYVSPLVTRDEHSFIHTMTPYLVLALDDHEMNFLRLADDESTFQTEAPETDLGPSGPGPAFHTGQTVPSVSDLDFEQLALESVDGSVSTIGGSLAVQDGISTVYNRNRVLARSAAPSVASEQFTDGDAMSVDYAEAEYEVPADHQTRGQSLAHMVEQMNDEDEYDLESLDLDLDGDSDSNTIMGDDDEVEAETGGDPRALEESNINTETAHSGPLAQKDEDEADWSEGFEDSDFEVIKEDEAISTSTK